MTANSATRQAGLRERKKQRTRTTLIDAALDLFLEHGYEATTIDDIAAQVDVSPRTFFRYFAGKEDVALAKGVEVDERVFAALADRPDGEPPLPALRQAVLTMLRASASSEGVGRFLKIQHLISRTPALLAGNLGRAAAAEELLTGEIARRQGVDPACDMRPRILVAVVYAALRVGLETMCADPRRDADRLVELVEQAVDLATAGLPGQWSSTPARW